MPEHILSAKARRTTEPPIAWLMQMAIDDPQMISLAAGFVDQESLPAEKVAECVAQILTVERNRSALQYGSSQGLLSLRQEVSLLLEQQGAGRSVSPDEILLTAGSQQVLHLVTDALINEGDIVLVEDPTYFVYTGTLQAAGAKVVGVPVDEQGIVPEALEDKLRFLERSAGIENLKLVYLMTYFQNPTGTCTAWDRKEKLLEILRHHCDLGRTTFVIEDAAYKELRFGGGEIPYLKALDPENSSVVLMGSFSKSFSPGLRVGFGWLPRPLLKHVLRQKGNEDFGSSNFCQHVVRQAIVTGLYAKHIEMLKAKYRAKRDLMLECLGRSFPDEVKVIKPLGGLYIWASLPRGISTGVGGPLFQEAVQRKVLYVPGGFCYCEEPGIEKPANNLRLSFGMVTQENIVEGMARLGEAVSQSLR